MLFGQSVNDALPADSDVRGFNDVMECLDYSVIESKHSERGCPPYPPKVMVKILGYAYSNGLRSSRKIEHRLKVDVEYIWLAGGLKPDHNTISRFRKENWQELDGLFRDSVRVCCEAGLVFLNAVATDGTKMVAAASKKRVYTESRLERELAAVEEVLREAEEVDCAEDKLYGPGNGSQLPEHLRDAKSRKEKLQEIANRLRESKKSSVVETDPESRVMLNKGGTRPCYNMQACVDAESQVIVAMQLTQNENDVGLLPEMIQEVETNTGLSADLSLVDCGYANEETIKWLSENDHDVLMPLQENPQESNRNDLFSSRCFLCDDKRDVLICPAGRELIFKGTYRTGSGHYSEYSARGCSSCSFCKQCVRKGKTSRTVSISVVAKQRKKMRERLKSEEGRQLYALRKQTVEPVFGQMKFNHGFSRLSLWGFAGAAAETALMCMAHNVMKCAKKAVYATHLAIAELIIWSTMHKAKLRNHDWIAISRRITAGA